MLLRVLVNICPQNIRGPWIPTDNNSCKEMHLGVHLWCQFSHFPGGNKSLKMILWPFDQFWILTKGSKEGKLPSIKRLARLHKKSSLTLFNFKLCNICEWSASLKVVFKGFCHLFPCCLHLTCTHAFLCRGPSSASQCIACEGMTLGTKWPSKCHPFIFWVYTALCLRIQLVFEHITLFIHGKEILSLSVFTSNSLCVCVHDVADSWYLSQR